MRSRQFNTGDVVDIREPGKHPTRGHIVLHRYGGWNTVTGRDGPIDAGYLALSSAAPSAEHTEAFRRHLNDAALAALNSGEV